MSSLLEFLKRFYHLKLKKNLIQRFITKIHNNLK